MIFYGRGYERGGQVGMSVDIVGFSVKDESPKERDFLSFFLSLFIYKRTRCVLFFSYLFTREAGGSLTREVRNILYLAVEGASLY